MQEWNSSELEVLRHIDPELREQNSVHTISDPDEYSKTLSGTPLMTSFVSLWLISYRRKTDGSLLLAKILLQRMWEWNDHPMPQELEQTWQQWRAELSLLADRHIPRCYFPEDTTIAYRQLHGFSDASKPAYSGVVYLRLVDTTGSVHISLVMAKTMVTPIKRLTIPHLELCGAHPSQLLRH